MGCSKTLPRFFLVLLFLIIGSSAFRIENESNRKPTEDIKVTEGSIIGEFDILHDRVKKPDKVIHITATITKKAKKIIKNLYSSTYDCAKKIVRKAIQYSISKNKFPRKNISFKADYACDKQNIIDTLYEGTTAKKNFNQLLKKMKVETNLLNELNKVWFQTPATGLHKGHLVPYADMLNEDEAILTNEYINVAPQWGNFNSVNWKQIEEKVRESDPNKVTTGTYGILKVLKVEMYLNPVDKTYEVPQYFWKLVCPKPGTAPFFIIGINFIFDEKFFGGKVTYDQLVREVCKKPITTGHGFLPANPKDIKYGYTFVCEPKDVKPPFINEQTC